MATVTTTMIPRRPQRKHRSHAFVPAALLALAGALLAAGELARAPAVARLLEQTPAAAHAGALRP